MATNNTVCLPVESYNANTVSPSLSTYMIVYTVITYVCIIFGFIWWYRNRQIPYLRRRNFDLMTLSGVALMMNILAGLVSRAIGDAVPCTLYYFLYLYSFPGISWPFVVRLFLWVNRIKFNFAIANQISEKGLQRINTEAPEIRKERILASTKFGWILSLAFLVPLVIVCVVVSESACSACASVVEPAFIVLITFAGILMVAAAIALYQIREVPDLFHLKSETIAVVVIVTLLGVPGFTFLSIDFLGVETANPQVFAWGILVDFGFILGFLISGPLQVWFATRKSKDKTSLEERMRKLFNSARGQEFFGMYLATALSMESLLFYQAVDMWKREYSNNEELSHSLARVMYGTYIDAFSSSYLEINIGSKTRRALADVFVSAEREITPDVFDAAQNEVFSLMADNHFRNFEGSDFYKLYIGEVEPDGLSWVYNGSQGQFNYISSNLDTPLI